MPEHDIDLITVVGKPLVLPHIPSPSEEDVDNYHQTYVKRMQELFDKYKGKYAPQGATLELY